VAAACIGARIIHPRDGCPARGVLHDGLVPGLDVLLVDDQSVMADALAQVLSARDEIADVVIATSSAEARAKLVGHRFDAVIVDVRLAGENGLDLVRELSDSQPSLPALVMTAFPDPSLGAAAIWAGAHGFVGKHTSIDELADAVRTVASGGSCFSPHLLTQILAVLREQAEVAHRVNLLSAREADILRLMVEGQSRVQIAHTLYLSVNTVRSHVRSVLRKLEVHSSLEAVSIALRAGMRPGSDRCDITASPPLGAKVTGRPASDDGRNSPHRPW
jgi:DNA-binding NarL/FixJ family response regulator